jgi:hypothetical protein
MGWGSTVSGESTQYLQLGVYIDCNSTTVRLQLKGRRKHLVSDCFYLMWVKRHLSTCVIASCNNKSKSVTIVYILVLEIKVQGKVLFPADFLPRKVFQVSANFLGCNSNGTLVATVTMRWLQHIKKDKWLQHRIIFQCKWQLPLISGYNSKDTLIATAMIHKLQLAKKPSDYNIG